MVMRLCVYWLVMTKHCIPVVYTSGFQPGVRRCIPAGSTKQCPEITYIKMCACVILSFPKGPRNFRISQRGPPPNKG